jgi:hypothetical protein
VHARNKVHPQVTRRCSAKAMASAISSSSPTYWASSLVRRSPNAKCVRIRQIDFNSELRRVAPSFLIVDVEGGEYELLRKRGSVRGVEAVPRGPSGRAGKCARERGFRAPHRCGLALDFTLMRKNVFYFYRRATGRRRQALRLPGCPRHCAKAAAATRSARPTGASGRRRSFQKANDRFSERRGEVHRAAVAADQPVALRERRDQHFEASGRNRAGSECRVARRESPRIFRRPRVQSVIRAAGSPEQYDPLLVAWSRRASSMDRSTGQRWRTLRALICKPRLLRALGPLAVNRSAIGTFRSAPR